MHVPTTCGTQLSAESIATKEGDLNAHAKQFVARLSDNSTATKDRIELKTNHLPMIRHCWGGADAIARRFQHIV